MANKLAILVTAASIATLASLAEPASALTTTSSLQNTVTNAADGSTSNLQFKAFNSTNFSSIFSGLEPNQSIRLDQVRLSIQGTAAGTFTLTNQVLGTSINLAANNSVASYNFTARGLASAPSTVAGNTALNLSEPALDILSISQSSVPPSGCTGQWTSLGGGNYGCITYQTGTSTISNLVSTPASALTFSALGNNLAFWTTGTTGTNNTNLSLPVLLAFAFNANNILNSANTPIAPTSTAALYSYSGTTALAYDYSILTNEVPAPLPMAGAGIAFAYSRRLRKRIKLARQLA